jgi:hypothetical protein
LSNKKPHFASDQPQITTSKIRKAKHQKSASKQTSFLVFFEKKTVDLLALLFFANANRKHSKKRV